MFEHSVKVPRHYKIAANIFKKVSTEGGSVKTLLYDDKLKHFRTNVLYALITETIKHAVDIEKIFESCEILTKEPRLDPWLAKVLTAELLYGKKALPGKSKPEQTILSYKEQFEKLLPAQQDDSKTKVVRRPRYVRINTNLLATSDAIRAFQDEGYKFIRCTSGSYNDYLQQVQGLTEYDFTQDYHVKTVFVFAPGTKMHEHDLYLDNQIILQDKATALAVHLLAPPPGSVVLDMCAAPGMKTTQLAAYLRNQGKIYAVERNEERYQTLCDFVEKTGSKCVKTFHRDSLEIKRGGDCDDVEYILLDPSCSGSGMDLHVHNYIEESRLARLTSLQEKFLKHAMNSFPNAKRIVYSTCSLFPEENERVITNVVKTSRAKWRVQDVKELLKGQWNNFGSGMYGSMGTRCLYAVPDSDLTTGFFLAVLDRDEKSNENNEGAPIQKNNITKDKKSKEKKSIDNIKEESNETEEEVDQCIELDNQDSEVKKQKWKKNKKEKYIDENTNYTDEILETNNKFIPEDSNENNETNGDVKQKRKKNKKTDKTEILDENNTIISETNEVNDSSVSYKKKKKRKTKDFPDNGVTNEGTSIEEIIDHSTVVNISDSINEIKKKKKKRKLEKDSSETLQHEEDSSIENPIYMTNNGDSIKHKNKKKKDTRDVEENSESLDLNETVENVTLKPKKRKKNKESDNLNTDPIVDGSLKKKKKKHVESAIVENDDPNEESPRKKKKHKE